MDKMIGSDTSSTPYVVDNIRHRKTEKCKLKRYFVQHFLSSVFRTLGASIGKHPLWYCFVPLLVTVSLSFRIYWVRVTKDVEYLYSPINTRAIQEREAVNSIFPPTSDGFDPLTILRLRRMGTVLIVPKDGESVLRDDILKEAAHIDNIIYNIVVNQGGKNYTYEDLCSKQRSGGCSPNDVLRLLGKAEDIKRKRLLIRYPFEESDPLRRICIYAIGLGGVTIDENDYLIDAKALRLIYILNDTSEEKDSAGQKWEDYFQEVLLKYKSVHVKLTIATADSINQEYNKVTEMALPLIGPTGFAISTFAALSCMTTNWVTCKPLVAIAGCLSPFLSIAAAFGFLLLCGFEYVDLNISILFLLLGIGLDDSFVILAAWRRTDPKQEVDVRMSQAYESSAMSITITSITNILSLCIGMGIPYRIVRIFCYYAAVSMFLDYVYQITFFGGVLALSGYREKKNQHPLLCITIKKEHMPNSKILRLLYFGLEKDKSSEKIAENLKSAVTKPIFLLTTTFWGKTIVIASFVMYIITSSYCLKFVKDGFDYRDAMPYNSYLIDYFNAHYKYFTQYPQAIHIVINTTLDYSDKRVQKDIEDIIENIHSGPNMANFKISWLKYYLQSLEESVLKLSYNGYNMSHPEDFISGLKSVFLKLPNAHYFRPHIKFNHNETQIVASRFMIFSKNVDNYEDEKKLISTLFSKSNSFKYPLYIHNAWFPLYSIVSEILPSCLEAMCTAAATMILVFFIFIPHPMCLIGMTIAIASILNGVMGYMALWDVTLNPIAMICIITSIGLSLDYSAHISYAYLSCKEGSPDEKTKIAISHAGYPIIQGCLSTFLGVAVLAFCSSKLFLVFFKVVTLVILTASYHGLLVIPVLLSTFEGAWKEVRARCRRKAQIRKASHNNNIYKGTEHIYDSVEDDEYLPNGFEH